MTTPSVGALGAPHGGAALLRRTSVLGLRPKTLMPGEFTSPEQMKNICGIQKNDHTFGVVIFLVRPKGLEIAVSQTTADYSLRKGVICSKTQNFFC